MLMMLGVWHLVATSALYIVVGKLCNRVPSLQQCLSPHQSEAASADIGLHEQPDCSDSGTSTSGIGTSDGKVGAVLLKEGPTPVAAKAAARKQAGLLAD
jgi:hypothetical protein